MNKKLIAAAVSAAVVAPVASHADAVLYGRINNAIDINDTDGSEDADSTTHLRNVVSRIGVRANAETNSGLGVHGHYEFLTVSDREEDDDGSGIDDTRIATVGVSGGFGRFDVGQQWSAYFNTFGTLVSPTYSLGYYLYSSVGGGVFRASNTIKYSNTFGPVTAQLDVRLNENGAEGGDVAEKISGEGIGLGLSFAVTDNITIAAAFDSEDGAGNDGGKVDAVAPLLAVAPTTLAALQWDAALDGTEVDIATTEQQAGYIALAADTGLTGDAATANLAEKRAAFIENLITEANEDRPERNGDNQSAPLDDTDVTGYTRGEDGNPEHRTDNDSPNTDRIGIAVKANFGGYWATLGWQNYSVDDNENTPGDDEVDIDTMFLWGGGSISEQTSWMLGYSMADDARDAVARVTPLADADAVTQGDQPRYGAAAAPGADDSTQVTLGIYHNLGGGMRLYYEGVSLDSENKTWDGVQHLFGMRVDF